MLRCVGLYDIKSISCKSIITMTASAHLTYGVATARRQQQRSGEVLKPLPSAVVNPAKPAVTPRPSLMFSQYSAQRVNLLDVQPARFRDQQQFSEATPYRNQSQIAHFQTDLSVTWLLASEMYSTNSSAHQARELSKRWKRISKSHTLECASDAVNCA